MKKNTINKTQKFRFRTLVLTLAVVLIAVCVPATTHTEAKTTTVTKISAASKKLDIGKSFTLKIYTRGNSVIDNKGKPAVVIDKDKKHYWFDYKTKAKWSSSNTKVATVNSSGKVTGKKKGTAVITAKANGKTYKCKVTVLRPISKKLLKFVEIPTAGNGFGGAGLAYKITNNNDYTVEFSLWGDFYAMNPDKGYKYEWTGKENYYCGTYVIAPGESVYTTKDTPNDNFYQFEDGTLSKYPDSYYDDDEGCLDYEKFEKVEGFSIKNLEREIVAARTYTKFKVRIEDFAKSKHKSEVKNIKIHLSADGKKLSVTNKGKTPVTNLRIFCLGLNSKGEINRVIGLMTYRFGTRVIKPGKTYTITLGGEGTNWENFFGKNGVPDKIVINNADDTKIAY